MTARIRNIVFAFPAMTGEEYNKNGAAYASFFTELLGLRVIREDWLKVGTSLDAWPQLAFGDGPFEDKVPRWPDPDYPQQLHLDISVPDLDAADELVQRMGATRLRDDGDHRIYADPVGHPFCLYPDAGVDRPSISRVVVDCPDPDELAAFYGELVGPSSDPKLAFQRVKPYNSPRWPDPEYPQQIHLDLYADDAASAQQLVARLGLTPLRPLGGSCPVYADPAGHPFCLCSPGQ